MKTYADLNLKELREKCDIDFAHYTYRRGQCSCCYGPKNLAKTHWRKGIDVENVEDYSYILFKNADNGSGHVTKNDELNDIEFVEWGELNDEKLNAVCKELSIQYGDNWIVLVPNCNYKTIIIVNREYRNFTYYMEHENYDSFYENGQKFDKE